MKAVILGILALLLLSGCAMLRPVSVSPTHQKDQQVMKDKSKAYLVLGRAYIQYKCGSGGCQGGVIDIYKFTPGKPDAEHVGHLGSTYMQTNQKTILSLDPGEYYFGYGSTKYAVFKGKKRFGGETFKLEAKPGQVYYVGITTTNNASSSLVLSKREEILQKENLYRSLSNHACDAAFLKENGYEAYVEDKEEAEGSIAAIAKAQTKNPITNYYSKQHKADIECQNGKITKVQSRDWTYLYGHPARFTKLLPVKMNATGKEWFDKNMAEDLKGMGTMMYEHWQEKQSTLQANDGYSL